MHHRKILKAVNICEKSDDHELTQKRRRGLPFIRSSKPVKRCPSPNVVAAQENSGDPFSHLLPCTDNVDSNQSIGPQGDAYRKLGSLSGQRVCRRNASTSHDTVAIQSNRITNLPPWEKLVSKRRGGKRKELKKNTCGAWRAVDEHVAQLKRKAACLDRSATLNNLKESTTNKKTEITKLCEPQWDYILKSGARDSVMHKEDLFDIKPISSEPQLFTNSTKCEVNSSVSYNSLDFEGPAWKPTPVVGKSLENSSSELPISTQNWLDKLDQDNKVPSTDSSDHRIQSTQLFSTSDSSVNRQGHARRSFNLEPQSIMELSFQRVPGSENLDMGRLTSPWPDMWDAPPQSDKFNEE